MPITWPLGGGAGAADAGGRGAATAPLTAPAFVGAPLLQIKEGKFNEGMALKRTI